VKLRRPKTDQGIVTEAGVHPNVSALVYVAARAPGAGDRLHGLG
jgi:hypothetical protein